MLLVGCWLELGRKLGFVKLIYYVVMCKNFKVYYDLIFYLKFYEIFVFYKSYYMNLNVVIMYKR